MFARATAIEGERLYPSNPDTAETLYGLGLLRSAQSNYGEAESYLNRALQMQRKILLPHHSDIARTLEAKADLARKMGHAGEAASCAAQAKSIRVELSAIR